MTYKGVGYAIEQRGEAWAIRIGAGAYFLTAGDPPDDAAGKFLRARMRNTPDPERPAFIASQRYPLMLHIDRWHVRAWPAFVPRARGASTYVQPRLNQRVAATKGPVWMFATRGIETSAGGEANPEQDVGDVAALARAWLMEHA